MSSKVVIDLTGESVAVAPAAAVVSPPPDKKKTTRGPGLHKKPKPTLFSIVDSAVFTAAANEIYFEVAGKPTAKKRVAWARGGHAYNPSKAAEKEFAGVLTSLCRINNVVPIPKFQSSILLDVHIEFFFPRKSNHREDRIIEVADVDNLCKFVLDALNKVLYTDDKQIVKVSAKKSFDAAGSLSGRTTVSITMTQY